MSSAIAIIDPFCLTPSTTAAADADQVGGTEAVVLKVARALCADFRFHFYQNGRLDMDRDRYGLYRPLDAVSAANLSGVTGIIVINSWKAALKARRLNPDCPIFLWSHTHPGRHNRRMGEALAEAQIEIVCTSKAHAAHVTQFLAPENRRLPKICWIHSPVDDDLVADGTPRDRDRLFFPGMPMKGITEVLAKFAEIRKDRPELSLDIAEPGNLAWPDGRAPQGVNFLGRLSHSALIARMRRSLCVFYPQTRTHDTTSLLLAEANAVGTPVIAQRGLGANDEIVGTFGQVFDTDDLKALGERIDIWRLAPPIVDVLPTLRMKAVAGEWRAKLGVAEGKKTHPPGVIPPGLAARPAAAPDK
ncbi:glycosyltransferase family 4 protein [Martelella lutilitoris]|uniref:Glycosyltransferase family 4 protein n=1 Tax=Martelella lutilitoris TaxID=2583532 RepID=A0A5C4JWB9_9HYPH|nr:glycosyltransferase [Martelella lutilitoris]TNB49743.1 glycosyltransferase family 4 protein [Martelella lutilitoris]